VNPGALIARVVPDVTGLDKQFDYLVPESYADQVTVGTLVRVPLGPRRVRAWVSELRTSSDIDGLRPIAAVVGLGPAPELVELASWAAHRWAGRIRPFLAAATPATVVKKPARSGARTWNAPPALPALRADGGVLRIAPCSEVLPWVLAAAANGPLLVCVPAIDTAARLGARLRGLGLRVAVLPKEWAVAAGGVDVVVGPRTAVWGPCPDLAGVLVLDEHDEALQDERSPTWHARDVAIERADRAGVPCWLFSPVPSLEALAWAGAHLQRPSRVDERAGWPLVDVIDRSREDSPITTVVTRSLLEAIRQPDSRVVAVLNTLGRSRRMVCRSCRSRIVCAGCSAAVSQSADSTLQCSRCGTSRPSVCQSCGSTQLGGIGIGVARLRDELERATGRRVVEVSSEQGDGESESSHDAVMVGTEAVLHRVRSADVVYFLDFDDELLAPRYRAAEEALGLLVRAARLVGPRERGGRIAVQTYQPRHEVIQAALHADPARLVEPELARRQLLGFPPAKALAVVSGVVAGEWLARATELDVRGPADDRWLVRADSWEQLADGLSALGPRPRTVRVAVDPHRL
jgi:primosomal protein N' (replication factor Y)